MFTVVRFMNAECSAETGMRGTCYTKSQCYSGSSSADSSGSCAKGFGTCCSGLFICQKLLYALNFKLYTYFKYK